MGILLYQNDKIVGVFETLRLAEDMATGIMKNGWARNFYAVEYKKNSCIKVRTVQINNIGEDVSDEEIESDSEESIDSEIANKRKAENIKDKHQINILKLEKEKIIESKNKYEIDLKLYNNFKENLENDINFEIPELFKQKYKIFHQLEQQNNLSWETFCLMHKEEDFHGNFSNIFQIVDHFENNFENNFINDVSSESSDSESESSNKSDDVIEIIEVVRSAESESD